MAQIDIGGLPAAIGLTGAEAVPIDQSGTTKKTTTNAIALLAFASTGAIQAALNTISTTQGTLLYRNASDWVALAPSTAGYVLTTQGPAANPTWDANLAADITIGSSIVTGGTNTRILYNNAGVVGEYTLTGTGTVVAMQTSPSFTTPGLGVASATSVTASGLLQAGTTLGISTDVLLNRDAANILAQRNGTNAQTFRLYGRFTDASNYNRWSLATSGTNNRDLLLVNEAAGTGDTGGSLTIGTGGSARLVFETSGSTRWFLETTGHFLAAADNTYDIGASGANRPRTIYVANGIAAEGGNISASNGSITAGASSLFYWGGRTAMSSPADGNMLVQNTAGTDFGRLMFGGTTSSFPALKRSSATLQVRLADDSDYASFIGNVITAAFFIQVGNGVIIKSISDGVGQLTNAGSADSWDRLQFGGATSSYPALKRSSTVLQARLADDSLYAGFEAARFGAGGVVSTSTFLNLAAATTASSALRFIQGAAPTSPVDGDMWREDNTNTGLKIRVNGVTKTVTLS